MSEFLREVRKLVLQFCLGNCLASVISNWKPKGAVRALKWILSPSITCFTALTSDLSRLRLALASFTRMLAGRRRPNLKSCGTSWNREGS